jgi:hypothetical protein
LAGAEGEKTSYRCDLRFAQLSKHAGEPSLANAKVAEQIGEATWADGKVGKQTCGGSWADAKVGFQIGLRLLRRFTFRIRP